MTLSDYIAETGTRLTDFAQAIGESASNVSDWKSGRRVPRLRALAKIEHVTGGRVTARDFVNPPPSASAEAA